jgi:gliding motility-associated-like protein
MKWIVLAVANVQNNQSEIYRINFVEKKLEYICLFPKSTTGGASTTEFMASISVKIGNVILNPADCQDLNGSIEITNSTGHGDLMYNINGSPFQASNLFNGLGQGTYIVRMIDQLGCQDSILIELPKAPALGIDDIIIQPAHCNESNGELTVSASGGVGELTYSLDSLLFQSSSFFNQLGPQAYTIWVRDTAGCIISEDVELESTQSSNILSVETTATSCAENNGSIHIIVDNETGTTYSINGTAFQSSSIFQNLGANNYLLTIHDKDGCADTISTVVAQSTTPEIEIVNISPVSCSDADGSLTLIGKQGLSPYQFAVDKSGFSNEGFFDSLSSGIHEAFISDQAGCLDSLEFQIPQTEIPFFKTIAIVSAKCLGENGSINADVGGGFPPLTVSLYTLNHEIVNHFNSLPAGNYILNVEDNAGCAIDSLVKVSSAECLVYIPNVFSPNGDGINDNFGIENMETTDIQDIELSIYDRWGSLVFHQKSNGHPPSIDSWDGSFHGRPCQIGVYTYRLTIERSPVEHEELIGAITLIR